MELNTEYTSRAAPAFAWVFSPVLCICPLSVKCQYLKFWKSDLYETFYFSLLVAPQLNNETKGFILNLKWSLSKAYAPIYPSFSLIWDAMAGQTKGYHGPNLASGPSFRHLSFRHYNVFSSNSKKRTHAT